MTQLNKTFGFSVYKKLGDSYTLPVSFRDGKGFVIDKTGIQFTCNYWVTEDMSGAPDGSFAVNTDDVINGNYLITMDGSTVTGKLYSQFTLIDNNVPVTYFDFVLITHEINREYPADKDSKGRDEIVIQQGGEQVIINTTGIVIDNSTGTKSTYLVDDDSGDGTPHGDLNSTDFTVQAGTISLSIVQGFAYIFIHKNIARQWVGPTGVTVGFGGNYIALKADLFRSALTGFKNQIINGDFQINNYPAGGSPAVFCFRY